MAGTIINLSIRDATLEDAALLSRLSKVTFHDTFASQNRPEDMEAYLSSNFGIDDIRRELSEPSIKYLIAEVQGNAVGYAKLDNKELPTALAGKKVTELERLYVLREYHGHKAGATLMNACIEYATTQDSDVLWLGVWEHNTRAKNFYCGFGFVKFGEHSFVLGSDIQIDWMMKLDLPKR